jgi:hypothetical protein
MSTDTHAALANEVVETAAGAERVTDLWVETALTVLFTASAVFLVSLISVLTGLL